VEKAELEQYGFLDDDADVTEGDLFLVEHYEQLFYTNPLELANAINAMSEDELIQFNNWVRYNNDGGMNAELMREKTNELFKYLNINPRIFGEALCRVVITEHEQFTNLQAMYGDKNKPPKFALLDTLFMFYPKFREHLPILEIRGIIQRTESGVLKWTRTKISLAQYFDYFDIDQQRRRWSVIEKVFSERNLRQYLYNHKEAQHAKPSRDFEEIKQLLGE
jgi:hypothetical protein